MRGRTHDGAESAPDEVAPGLSDPVPEPQVITLAVKSLHPPPAGTARHPSFAMVVSGQICATPARARASGSIMATAIMPKAGQIAASGNVALGTVRPLHVLDQRSELGAPPA
jgi:hypothetical protein